MAEQPTWRVVGDGKTPTGPFTGQQLRQMLLDGQLREHDHVLDEGGELWAALAAVRQSTPTIKPVTEINAHRSAASCLAFAPDGDFLATGGFDRCVRLWGVPGGKSVANFHPGLDDSEGPVGHDDTVSQVAFSPDGGELASSGWDGQVCVWNITTNKQRHILEGHEGAVNGVSYLPAGRSWSLKSKFAGRYSSCLLSAGADGTLRIWDTTTGEELRATSGFGPVSHFCLDPDGEHVWLAVTPRESPPHYLMLGDLKKTTDSAKLIRQVGGIRHVAASVDERYAAVSRADGRLRVWDMEQKLSQNPHHDWQAQQGELMGVAFSHDAHFLASAGSDGTVKLWNPATGELLATCEGHEGDAYDVAFSPDGRWLASCGKDGKALIWSMAKVRDGSTD